MILGVKTWLVTRGRERADDPATAGQGDGQSGPESRLIHPWQRGSRPGEPWIRLQVIAEQGLAREDRRNVHLRRRVTAPRIELDGVPARVEQRTRPRVFRENRQHPVFFELGNHQPIMRDEPLHSLRELGQESLRIENLLQGATDRRE
jgi:hypothetical protein